MREGRRGSATSLSPAAAGGTSSPVALLISNALTLTDDGAWHWYDWTGLDGTGIDTAIEVDGTDPTTLNVLQDCDITFTVVGHFQWTAPADFVAVEMSLPAPIFGPRWEPDPAVKDVSLCVRSPCAAGDTIRLRAYSEGSTGASFSPAAIVLSGRTT